MQPYYLDFSSLAEPRQLRRKGPALLALVGLLSCVLLTVPRISTGQTLTWVESKAEALDTAQKEGKLILLFAGRPSCLECQYMEYTVAESTEPPVASLIQYGFVPWNCDIDLSDEWIPYATGLSAFPLPMICIIAPTNMANSIDRSIGLQTQQTFYKRLLNRAQSQSLQPHLSSVSVTNGVARIQVESLAFGATTYLERATNLSPSANWTTATNFVSYSRTFTLLDSLSPTTTGVFYRVRTSQ